MDIEFKQIYPPLRDCVNRLIERKIQAGRLFIFPFSFSMPVACVSLMHIMQLYKRKDSRWVFPFLHEKLVGKGVLTAQSSLHRVNEYLKEIGDRLNLPYPLTTYVMRHSWASLMLESGSEIGVISQSLGHMSLQTTQIYLEQLSKSKMDKASEDMLDHLVRGSRKKQL